MKRILKMTGYLAIYYVLTIVIMFPIVKILTDENNTILKPIFDVAPAAFFGVTDPILCICFFLFFRYVRKQKLSAYANLSKININMVLLYAALGITLGVFSYFFVSTSFMKTNCPELTNMVKGFVAAGNGFALLYLVPMNSFYKEISYRGVMQNEVRNAKLPIWVAILIPVLMYCSLLVISGNVIGVLLYAFFGHILFGTIYYLGKSLWSTIIAQTVCTFSLVFIKHNVHKSFFTNQHSIIASALCIILLVVLMGILVKNSRSQSQGSVTNNNPAVNQ